MSNGTPYAFQGQRKLNLRGYNHKKGSSANLVRHGLVTLDLLNHTQLSVKLKRLFKPTERKMIDHNYHLDKHDTLPAFVD